MELKRRKKAALTIPVAAMGDIAFLLLIFFMLSSIAEAEKEIPINLPESRKAVEETHKFFNIYITREANNEVTYNYGFDKCTLSSIGLLTNYAQLKLLDLPQNLMKDFTVLIRADNDIPFEYIHGALESLKESGIHNVRLVSEKKGIK